jgi:hypothetical protein
MGSDLKREQSMLQRNVIKVAAWLEIIVGAGLVLAIDLVSRLLFAGAPEGVGSPLGRVAGVALFALGVGGVRSSDGGVRDGSALGLLVYNAGAAILLTWIAVGTSFRGVLLWPAVILHAVIATGLLMTFLDNKSR